MNITTNDGSGSRTIPTIGTAVGIPASSVGQTVMALLSDGSADIQYGVIFNGVTGSPQYRLSISIDRVAS